jgi:FG-GAP repeat
MARTSNGSTGKRRSKFGWALTIAVAAGVLLGAATIPDQGLWFRDITRSAGVAKKHQKRTFNNVYSSIMDGYSALGSAVAAGDYNGDGFEDLY